MTPIRTRKMLDPKGADAVMAAAEAYAMRNGHRVVIAVVDAHGVPLQLRRLDDTQLASADVAIDKARTAAIFIRPSRDIEAQVSGGRLGALALHGAVALTGGIPLVVDGEVVGAIGTSGETPDEDEAVSLAGAQAAFSATAVPALTADGARMAAEAVAAEATQRGVAPVAAVVDAAGELIHLWRPDAAQVASVGVASDKARTAARFRRESRDFEVQAATGRPSALHLRGAVPLQGGIPIVHDDHVVGAVGVSGASSADEDQELAVLGARAVMTMAATDSTADGATFVPAEALRAKFETGGLVVDTVAYKVDAGRRSAPGEVELHGRVTDIMYVQRGTATVVTGGELVDARDVARGETRARSTTGGTAHELGEGDVFVIPAGVAHQFTKVSDPFLYYVVKVG
jgi:uncharacterized protein GlcG (DUF336 family)